MHVMRRGSHPRPPLRDVMDRSCIAWLLEGACFSTLSSADSPSLERAQPCTAPSGEALPSVMHSMMAETILTSMDEICGRG